MATITNAEELVRKKAQELFPNSPVDQAYFMGLAKQESGFNPSAYNAQGDAYGLFQFAGDMRSAYGMDTKSPPDVQLAAAGDYLKKLHKKHGGNWQNILAEHYMGLPRFNRAQAGKSDAEVKSFYASHLPKVVANALRFGSGQPPGKDQREITLAQNPAPPAPTAPVSPAGAAAQVAQQQSFAAPSFLPSFAPQPVAQQAAQRLDQLQMLMRLLASNNQPLTFGRSR